MVEKKNKVVAVPDAKITSKRPGKLVSFAVDATQKAEAEGLLEQLGCLACFCRTCRDQVGADRRVGCAFVDILHPKAPRPGNEKNVGMLYVVGPKAHDGRGHGPGIEAKADFLKDDEKATRRRQGRGQGGEG